MRALLLPASALMFLALAPQLAAAADVADAPLAFNPQAPIEWQKSALEERILNRITRSLKQSIPEKYFAVTVNVSARPAPDPAKSRGGGGGSSDEPVPLGKLSFDASLLLAREELIAAPDVFKLIRTIDLTVLLDMRVPDAKIEVARALVIGAAGDVGGIKPTITVKKVELVTRIQEDPERDPAADKADEKKPEPPKEEWDFKRWLTELKVPLSLLMLAMLACGSIIIIFFGYRGMESRRIAIMEARHNREEQEYQAKVAATSQSLVGAKGDSTIKAADMLAELADTEKALGPVERGVDRFRRLAAEAPDRASQLIRQWIRNPKRGGAEALAVVPQILTIDVLNRLFSYLGTEEKKEWRRFVAMPLDAKAIMMAQSFIGSQIVENFLVPGPKLDPAIRGRLGSLSLADCVDLAKEDVEIGGMLANLLPPGQVARMFAVLPQDVASAVTSAGVRMTDEELASRLGELKQALSRARGSRSVPFLENASELMREVTPERESSIFNALAEAGEFRLLESTARQFFPAELVIRLPAHVLKICLDMLPNDKKAELIFSLDKGGKERILEAFGNRGSKLRQMIDIEIERVEQDEFRKKRSERNRNGLWKHFADLVRELIKRDEMVAEFAEVTLNGWLHEKSDGQVGGEEHAA